MNIETMTIDELEARRAQISGEIDAPEADLDALEAEARAINDEIEKRKADEAQKVEIRKAVAEGAGEVKQEIKKDEGRKMTNEEIRNSKEYINAYANYIKTGRDDECRALLTELAEGVVPVPSIVEGRVRQAWQRSGLLDLVRKTYVRGVLRVGFEVSATGADIHEEGAADLTEEELVLGIVTLIPASIKKWITISDEALDMSGEEFLDYIYDELTYQIAKKLEDSIVQMIINAPTTPNSTSPGAPEVLISAISIGDIALALGQLADNAANPIVIMNKATWAAYMAAKYSASFAADPFEGLPVYYSSQLPNFADASDDSVYALVGDPGVGIQANFPNGAEIIIKKDDLSLAEKDLVKLVGRQYVGIGYVSNNAFVKLVKAE